MNANEGKQNKTTAFNKGNDTKPLKLASPISSKNTMVPLLLEEENQFPLIPSHDNSTEPIHALQNSGNKVTSTPSLDSALGNGGNETGAE